MFNIYLVYQDPCLLGPLLIRIPVYQDPCLLGSLFIRTLAYQYSCLLGSLFIRSLVNQDPCLLGLLLIRTPILEPWLLKCKYQLLVQFWYLQIFFILLMVMGKNSQITTFFMVQFALKVFKNYFSFHLDRVMGI